VSFDPRGPHDVVHEDVEWGRPDGEPLLARIYRPAVAPGPFPALVDVHGGAWTYFDRRADFHFDTALAACGMIVVALDFRQAPAHRWPTALEDVVAGIRWTKTNAVKLGTLAEPLGVIGSSSGGHLAVRAALRSDLRVGYALPLWPILDPLARYRYLLGRRANPTPARDPFFQCERLIAAHEAFFVDERAMHEASALRVVEAGEAPSLPPLWIAHPELDENVTLEMTERFVAAYRRAGGIVELEVFAGIGHGFANFPGPDADRCIARMREFVARRLAV
jgi:acetyl esterase/lipase